MRKVLIYTSIVFGSFFFVNAESGSGGDCPCTVTTVCRDSNLNPIGEVTCTGPEGTCEMGLTWCECDGVRSFCVAPL